VELTTILAGSRAVFMGPIFVVLVVATLELTAWSDDH
jgi:hypothetical protein